MRGYNSEGVVYGFTTMGVMWWMIKSNGIFCSLRSGSWPCFQRLDRIKGDRSRIPRDCMYFALCGREVWDS